MLGRFWRPSWVVLLSFVLTSAAEGASGRRNAEGWRVVEAPPVAPAAAASFLAAGGRAGGRSVATRPMPLSAGSRNALVSSPEIQELGRGLDGDPLKMYNWVRNNIRYEAYFGSRKGALITLLDRAGNDCDQASLLIALLRSAGFGARYVYGLMVIPDPDLSKWIGIADLPDQAGVTEPMTLLLAYGGIPVNDHSVDPTIPKEIHLLGRVWVEATVNGVPVQLDPAYKTYEPRTRVDLAAALQFDRTSFIAAVSNGATVTPDFVQRLDDAGLRSQLNLYSGRLASYLRTRYPNTSMEEILGGEVIVPVKAPSLNGNLLFAYSPGEFWDEVPTAYETTLTLDYDGVKASWATSALGTSRIWIDYAPCSGTYACPRVHLDDQVVGTGLPTVPKGSYPYSLAVDHPYAAYGGAYADDRAAGSLPSAGVHSVVMNLGVSAAGPVDAANRRLSEVIGAAAPPERIAAEALGVIGASYFRQSSLAYVQTSKLFDVIRPFHHEAGVVTYNGSYGVDMRSAMGSPPVSRTATPLAAADATALSSVLWVNLSGLEHSVIQQFSGASTPVLSTVRALSLANGLGHRIFHGRSDNYVGVVKPSLSSAWGSHLADFEASTQAGYWVLVPESPAVAENHWTGWLDTRDCYCISNSTAGGVGLSTERSDPKNVYGLYNKDPKSPQDWILTQGSLVFSVDPIDLATGYFVEEGEDLGLGPEAPLGVRLRRTYNSGRGTQVGPFGPGWTHNLQASMRRKFDPYAAFGNRQPWEASALLAYAFISFDLQRNLAGCGELHCAAGAARSDALARMSTILASNWLMDQLVDNVVEIDIGGGLIDFFRMPDGSFSPPPGSTSSLAVNSDGTATVRERSGLQFLFAADGRLSAIQDADGNEMTFAYGPDGLSTVRDAYGRMLQFGWTGGLVTSVTDTTGRSVSYTYTAGQLSDFTDVEGKRWRYGYAPLLSTVTDPLGVERVSNEYDGLGRVKTQKVPRQQVASVTFRYLYGLTESIEVDPAGSRRTYLFDGKGRAVGEIDPVGSTVWTRRYDGQNNLIEETNARGSSTRYEYDGNHNLVRRVDASGTASWSYDAGQRVTDRVDAAGAATHFVRDPFGRIVRTVGPTGAATTVTFDGRGRATSATNADGITTTTTYDGFGNIAVRRSGSEPAITTSTDSAGRLLSITDGAGASSRFSYDRRGLVVGKTDPRGSASKISYDDAGRPASVTDRNGTVVSTSYTQTGKVAAVLYSNGTPSVSFSYDSLDRMTSMRDGVGTTTFAYDAVGNLVRTRDAYGQQLSFGYDAARNLTALTYPDGKTARYTYDARNRLSAVEWSGKTAAYAYDAAGRVLMLRHFNGVVERRGYDAAGRLLSTSVTDPAGAVVDGYVFTRSAGGRVLSVTRSGLVPVVLEGRTVLYSYSPLGERLLQAGSTALAYDAANNVTAKGSRRLTFDGRHLVSGVTEGSLETTFTYDGLGRRVRAVRNGVETRYVLDPSGNVIAEADAANRITRYLVQGQTLLAMGDGSGRTFSFHFDPLGSTSAVTDGGGAVVNAYAYSPFGEIRASLEAVNQPYRFAGRFGATYEAPDLYAFRFRLYDPSLGRWMSEDPEGVGAAGTNLSVYSANNPIMSVDPFGAAPAWNPFDEENFDLYRNVFNGASFVVAALAVGAVFMAPELVAAVSIYAIAVNSASFLYTVYASGTERTQGKIDDKKFVLDLAKSFAGLVAAEALASKGYEKSGAFLDFAYGEYQMIEDYFDPLPSAMRTTVEGHVNAPAAPGSKKP